MRHLLSAADLSAAEVARILDLSEEMAEVAGRPVKKLPALRGRTVVNLFFEDSTRTRSSFEIAGKWLSADVINISAKGSSVSKGESLRDTVLTVAAMGVDALVIRHHASGAPWQAAAWVDAHILNAGDGTHEHPTQALLDAFTLRRHFRLTEPERTDFSGLTIAIVGDITHSRVARSNVLLLRTLGAEVVLVAPPTLLPAGVDTWPVTVSSDLDEVLPTADAVMMLRVQRERMSGGYFPTAREYTVGYGLTRLRLCSLKPHTAICHPGPMNRGLEISADAADAANSLILDQVAAGVAVRMSVLYELLGGADELPAFGVGGGRPVNDILITGADLVGAGRADLFITGGRFADPSEAGGSVTRFDADGLIAVPGLVDLHTHLREPGREDAETVATGTAAAARGGFTAVLAMANTDPVTDTAEAATHVSGLGRRDGHAQVVPVGAVSKGLAGEELAELGLMARSSARVRVFSDDGHCVSDARLMRRALEYVRAFDGVDRPARPGSPAGRTRSLLSRGRDLGSARIGRLAGGGRVHRRGSRCPTRGADPVPAARLPRVHGRNRRGHPLGQGPRHRRHGRGRAAPPAADHR